MVHSEDSWSSLAKTAVAGVATNYLNTAAQSIGSALNRRIRESASGIGDSVLNWWDEHQRKWDRFKALQNRSHYRTRVRHTLGSTMFKRRFGRRRRRFVRPFRRRYRRRASFRFRRRFVRRTRFRRRRTFRRFRFRRNTFARKTGYRRVRRRQRANARGSIRSLYRKMITGESLPYIAFGKARLNQVFTQNFTPTITQPTYVLNSLAPQVLTGATDINYNGLYNLLYQEYLVLGAKLRLKIIPNTPPALGSDATRINQQTTGNSTANGSNGYWYLRYYYPGRVAGDTDSIIGVPITNQEATDSVLAARWAREIDFLQDRSVVFSRDGRSWYTALHESRNDANDAYLNLTSELGVWNRDKGVTLSFGFSARKIYRMPSILSGASGQASTDENPFWAPFNSDPSVPLMVRLGYVSFFYQAGTPTLRFYPTLSQSFKIYGAIDYFCAFRRPTDTSTLRSVPSMAALLQKRTTSVPSEVLPPEFADHSALKRVRFEDEGDDDLPV